MVIQESVNSPLRSSISQRVTPASAGSNPTVMRNGFALDLYIPRQEHLHLVIPFAFRSHALGGLREGLFAECSETLLVDRQDLHEDNNALVFWKKHRIISLSPRAMIIIEGKRSILVIIVLSIFFKGIAKIGLKSYVMNIIH